MTRYDLLFEDDDLIAVAKPAGCLTVPGRTVDKQDCLYRQLLCDYPGLLVVHRLDQDTSGIVLFARHRTTQSELGRQFAAGRIRKDYIAWVSGVVEHDRGEIDRPVGRLAPGGLPPRYCVHETRGKPAQTQWHVLQRRTDRTRLWLRPRTGRSHQLRVHCLCVGHPIVGDRIYGRQAADRMYLHAFRLRFSHPRRADMLTLKAPLPWRFDE